MTPTEHILAVYVDFENLALGLKGKQKGKFDIRKVLERLLEKGKIVVKKAYSDWAPYPEYKKSMHEAGIELVEIPRRRMSGKNSADMRMCVDAMDLCYSKEHINSFAIISGDSDFTPLVSKLKENGKSVFGLGMKDSTSELLISACDEFIFYEELTADSLPRIDKSLPGKKQEAFQLLIETVAALMRENKDVLWSSMVKDTMKRKRPNFSEAYHGYRSFSQLLEDAEKHGLVTLSTDARSGTYVIKGFENKTH